MGGDLKALLGLLGAAWGFEGASLFKFYGGY